MSDKPELLFVLSADFGEYVNANLFSRNQPFQSHFALPRRLINYVGPHRTGVFPYGNIKDLVELTTRLRPEVVLLCSGYLFSINRIFTHDELTGFVAWLHQSGVSVGTTDPWLRIWALKPDTRFTIYSGHRTEPDAELSDTMTSFQKVMEEHFSNTPHVFSVPINTDRADWLSFYNDRFAQSTQASHERRPHDQWLFVMSREDLTFLMNLEDAHFPHSLAQRLTELLENERNRITLVAPPRLFDLAKQDFPDSDRLTLLPYCDFDTFEGLVRAADIAVYWNVLSASLLYCLYYRVPAVFLSKGHQVRVCSNLYDHAVEHVYQGRPPLMLNPQDSFPAEADGLIDKHRLDEWVSAISAHFSHSPSPSRVIHSLRQHERK